MFCPAVDCLAVSVILVGQFSSQYLNTAGFLQSLFDHLHSTLTHSRFYAVFLKLFTCLQLAMCFLVVSAELISHMLKHATSVSLSDTFLGITVIVIQFTAGLVF